jgi:hypothetical protein
LTRWRLSAKKDLGKAPVGQHDPKDGKGKTEPDQARKAQHGQRANVAVVACVGVMLLLVQVGLIFGVLPAGAIGAEPGKSDWWPTKQYSWTDVILAFTTFALLLATIVYAVVSFHQWRVLRETLAETRRANELSLRAWLVVEEVDLRKITTVDAPTFFLEIHVKNIGRVPAINVDVTLIPEIRPVPEKPPAAISPYSPGGVIAPSQTRAFPFLVTNITLDLLSHLRSGRLNLFLDFAVTATYSDVLDSRGETIQGAHYAWPFEERKESIVLDKDGGSMK